LPDPWSSPRIVGGLYCDFLVRDEARAETWLVLGESRGDEGAPVEARRREIERALTDVELAAPRVRPMRPLVRHTSSHEHRDRIERARAEIAAGEYYQVNLAHRFTRAIEGSPTDLYRRLRAVNPAPYMAYIAWDRESASDAESFPNGALLSASPELLFEFDGRTARTRPIKGTAPRGKTRAEDQCLARALLASEKDRAELAMIVDLERNDLGRVARPGSVRVERFPELASYASVHHLSADVVAEVRERVDAIDVLAALFPGGSVTGAPKLASMRAIAALEGEGRGFFTGSAGFIDARGQACFNILIRTLVWRPHAECTERFDGSTEQGDIGDVGEVSYHVGGGITWSSNAEDEDNESLAKGAALALALEASSPPQRPISRPSSRAKSSCASDTAREGVTR
jgi:para-aminobenzoate synthetase component 1